MRSYFYDKLVLSECSKINKRIEREKHIRKKHINVHLITISFLLITFWSLAVLVFCSIITKVMITTSKVKEVWCHHTFLQQRKSKEGRTRSSCHTIALLHASTYSDHRESLATLWGTMREFVLQYFSQRNMISIVAHAPQTVPIRTFLTLFDLSCFHRIRFK